MHRRNIFIIVLILIVSFSLLILLRPRDISMDILAVDVAVSDVMAESGLSETDLLSRTEAPWRKGFTRGLLIKYVYSPGKAIDLVDMGSRIRKAVGRRKGFRLEKIAYRKDNGHKGEARFDIQYGGNQVISIVLTDPFHKKRVAADEDAPRIALVLDDLGYSRSNLDRIGELDIPVTLAILPSTPYARHVASFADDKGIETIIHLPIEPTRKGIGLEKDTIMCDMAPREIRRVISDAFGVVPDAVGANNHMGSKGTADERIMSVVMEDMRKRGKFFLDSKTSSGSVCEAVARDKGTACVERDIFLDHIADRKNVAEQLDKAVDKALERGSIIAIGHDKAVTIDTIKEKIPGMKSRGVQFVNLSDLVRER